MARIYKPWTGKDVAFLRENYRTKGCAWCAERLGRNADSIMWAARTHGLSRPAASRFTAIDDEMIRRAYASKVRGAVGACAKALGRTPPSITRRAASLGLASRSVPARLPAEQVEFVRARMELAPARIAKLMRQRGWNVTAGRVTNLIRREGGKRFKAQNDDIMTVSEIEQALGVKRSAVSSWVRKGLLRAEVDHSSVNGGQLGIRPKYLARMLGRNPSILVGLNVDIIWLVAFLVQYGFYGRGGDDRDLYPRIVALKLSEPHLSLAEIAIRTGAGSADSVASLISRARRAGELPPVAKAA